MADYNSDRTGANIDATLDKVDVRDTVINIGSNTTNRVTVDSAGNLLVGTTDALPWDNSAGSNADNGAVVGSAYLAACQYNNASLRVNRTGSDGDLQVFYKNGATVGSIGVNDGRPYLASSTVGIRVSNALFPSNTSGVITDGAMNIGGTSGRFKDLYLSGGVYLGGTGAANKLDDYETGTFTPTITFGGGNTGLSMLVAYGQYTKIGRIVNVRMSFRFSTKGTSTGNVLISGLPFTALSTAGGFSSQSLGITGYAGFSGVSDNISIAAGENTTNVDMSYGSNTITPFNDTNFTGNSGNYFTISGTYETSA